MKSQTVQGIKFYFENFDYSFGQNVLSDLIRYRFQLDPTYYGTPSIKETFNEFKEKYPHIKYITLIKVEQERKTLEPTYIRKYLVSNVFNVDYSKTKQIKQ